MSDSGAQRPTAIAVGSRVTVIRTSGSRSGDTEPQVGIAVEDYTETVIDNSDLGRNWAQVLRWGDRPRRRPIGLRRRGWPRTRLSSFVNLTDQNYGIQMRYSW